jgi:hypothetical protein
VFLRNCLLQALSIARTSEKLTAQKRLVSSAHRSNSVYHSGPLGGVVRRSWQQEPLVARRRWRAPWECYRRVQQQPPPKLKMTSMEGPLGVLPVGPAAATTEAEEDVDGGLLGGCCLRVCQRPPPKLEKTSMAGLLEGAADGSSSSHHQAEDDVDGGTLPLFRVPIPSLV